LLIVEVETHAIVGIVTYPNMGGPGKIDHEPVFLHFQQDITDFQKETKLVRIALIVLMSTWRRRTDSRNSAYTFRKHNGPKGMV
jgi:hypothetical protein